MNKILANELSHIAGIDMALEAFLKDDASFLIKGCASKGIDSKEVESFLQDWNYDFISKNKNHLASHQLRLLSMAGKADVLDENFLLNIVTDSALLDGHDYGNLDVLKNEVEKIKESRELQNSIQRTM